MILSAVLMFLACIVRICANSVERGILEPTKHNSIDQGGNVTECREFGWRHLGEMLWYDWVLCMAGVARLVWLVVKVIVNKRFVMVTNWDWLNYVVYAAKPPAGWVNEDAREILQLQPE